MFRLEVEFEGGDFPDYQKFQEYVNASFNEGWPHAAEEIHAPDHRGPAAELRNSVADN
jgi:hypothetical protein